MYERLKTKKTCDANSSQSIRTKAEAMSVGTTTTTASGGRSLNARFA